MNRLHKLIYSNKLFALVMLAMQLIILLVGTFYLVDYRLYITFATRMIAIILILLEVNRTENPNFKITWIILIAIIPIFGSLLYMYIHLDLSSRAIGEGMEKAIQSVREIEESDAELLDELEEAHPDIAGTARFLSGYGASPAFKDTSVKYYSLGDRMIEDMLQALKGAKKFIFLEFFIINCEGRVWPEILSILKEKAKNGVEVRVIYDGMGCLSTLPKYYEEALNSEHIKCRTFLPIQPLLSTYQNNRDHRKIMVIDGEIAFNGGINLADEYANYIERFGHWKDVGVRLEGSAVSGFTGMFLQMWNAIRYDDSVSLIKQYINSSSPVEAEGIVIPLADSPLDDVNVGLRLYIDMINRASKNVFIMTPYLVLDDEMYNALRFAVQRGVDVHIILPHIPDKKYVFWIARTYYPMLMRAGVKIHEYTPGFVHAKVCECDSCTAVVGTINFDYRSLFLHHECATYMHGVPQIKDIHEDYLRTMELCAEVTPEYYRKINIFTKIAGRVARVLAPLI